MSHWFAILATYTACDADVRTGRFLLAAGTQFRSNRVPGTMYLPAKCGHLVDLNKVFVMLTTCHIMATYSRSFQNKSVPNRSGDFYAAYSCKMS